MASIKIYDLHPVGLDLLQDSDESFLDELSVQETGTLLGGLHGAKLHLLKNSNKTEGDDPPLFSPCC